MEGPRCPKCQADLSGLDARCPFCGSDRARGNAFCPECRADLVAVKRKCPSCGHELAPPSGPLDGRPDVGGHEVPRRPSLGNGLLTIGQIISVLGCVAIVVVGAYRAETVGPLEGVGGLLGIVYNMAMFVVFSRVKKLRN
jgi:hypothetical protein